MSAGGGDRPLTFRPSVDDRAQLDAFLKDVFKKYLEQRSHLLGSSSDQPSLNPSQGQTKEEDDRSLALRRASMPAATAAASTNPIPAGKQVGTLKQPPPAVLPTKVAQMAPAPRNPRPSKKRKISTLTSSPPTSPEAPDRPPSEPKSSTPAAAGSIWKSEKGAGPKVAAEPQDGKSEICSPEAKSVPTVNHEFIQRQLDSIARASLLRAKTIDIHAPDPEQDAPPNETPVQKRRRLERINGRRKRAKKLIEIDSLNERLVTLVQENNRLKSENADYRQKIEVIKKNLASGRSIASPGRQSTSQPGRAGTPLVRLPNQVQTQPSQSASLPSSRPSTLPSILPQSQPPRLLQLQQQVPPQAQLQPALASAATLPQHVLFSSLLSTLVPSPSPNQSSLLASLSTNNPRLQLQNSSILFRPQLQLQTQLQLPLQLAVARQQQQQQQQQQHPPQPQQVLPSSSGFAQLYAGNPAHLPPSTVSMISRIAQASRQPDQLYPFAVRTAPLHTGTSATTPVAAVASPEAARSGSPPPRNAKELKAWMEKQKKESKK
ncbi:expressed unknown protein [Seminavis robusta]|uniref:Uncharacterized protein n=1 Tax=Seminavis robusta TaxID=568900 RepID=A0A9N8H299_9STRA|nr:expressed unknown protein [Seminavis robusta]|eukprot:Sro15_g011110.1 n/a (547) ;mRNA; f:75037-76677